MQVKIIEEHGHDSALRGMSYSFMDNAEEPDSWWEVKRERAATRSEALAGKDGGHNKFLESIQLWIDVNACRALWSEFDTYRVGTTKQSTSTMHLLAKRAPAYDDFEEGTAIAVMDAFQDVWLQAKGDINVLKMNLPEGFLQRRIVCTNYKVLRNIIAQRQGHRLKLWDVFIGEIMKQVEHPELLQDLIKEPK